VLNAETKEDLLKAPKEMKEVFAVSVGSGKNKKFKYIIINKKK